MHKKRAALAAAAMLQLPEYWFQIPQEVIVGLDSPNPACAGAIKLRARIKPWLDWAILTNGIIVQRAVRARVRACGRCRFRRLC